MSGAGSPKGCTDVLSEENVFASLTYEPLKLQEIHESVKRRHAGAVVTFTGTTRDNFDGKTVTHLAYEAYLPLALHSLMSIAKQIKEKHGICAVSAVHRLGEVPVGEESIVIAVSSPHRRAAWQAAEELLELCKQRVEIWKLEEFEGDERSAWRSNNLVSS